jgi:hypothetical protein
VVNNWYKQLQTNPKVKIECSRLIMMIICLEISYERYLKGSAKMFREAAENDEVVILREQTPTHIIEIED